MVIRGPVAPISSARSTRNCFEAMYCNVPGLKVVMPSTPADAKGLLKTAIRDEDPVVFIETELLYGETGEVPDGEYLIPIGKGDINARKDCTIVAYSRWWALRCKRQKNWKKEASTSKWSIRGRYAPLDEDLIFSSVQDQPAGDCAGSHAASQDGGEIAYRVQKAAT